MMLHNVFGQFCLHFSLTNTANIHSPHHVTVNNNKIYSCVKMSGHFRVEQLSVNCFLSYENANAIGKKFVKPCQN